MNVDVDVVDVRRRWGGNVCWLKRAARSAVWMGLREAEFGARPILGLGGYHVHVMEGEDNDGHGGMYNGLVVLVKEQWTSTIRAVCQYKEYKEALYSEDSRAKRTVIVRRRLRFDFRCIVSKR